MQANDKVVSMSAAWQHQQIRRILQNLELLHVEVEKLKSYLDINAPRLSVEERDMITSSLSRQPSRLHEISLLHGLVMQVLEQGDLPEATDLREDIMRAIDVIKSPVGESQSSASIHEFVQTRLRTPT
jgi:hypothetical protein